MIEIIYKGEDEEYKNDVNIKLPKNVRQIGNCEYDNKKIYVEDFVMTYVKHFGSKDLKYGILLGNIKHNNGNAYLFITGAVCARPLLDNEIIFDEDVWTGLYEDIKTYFDEVEIIGWFASMPGMLENDMPHIQKIHLDNFAGNDKVCFLIDRVECEDSFYLYDDGGMKAVPGHYIYYEKNADMQSYMAMHIEENDVPADYEQSRKRSINATVHKIFFNQGEKREKTNTGSYGLAEYIGIKNDDGKNNESEAVGRKRRLPAFAYSASSFMLLAVLLGTIALMNTSGQLKDLKNTIIGMNNSKEPITNDDTAKIIDVAGNVETTAEKKEDNKLNVNNNEDETYVQSKDNKNTQVTTENKYNGEENSGTKEDDNTDNRVNQTTQENVTTQQETTSKQEEPEPTVAPVVKEPQYYIVKSGDSLYSISLKIYGNIDMINSIMQANNITNENYIKEGQTILLP